MMRRTLTGSILFACCHCIACGSERRNAETHSESGKAGELPASGGESEGGATGFDGGNSEGGKPNIGGNADGAGNANRAGNAGSAERGGNAGGGTASGGHAGTDGSAGAPATLRDAAGRGTVTAPWTDFCVATLTADFAVTDSKQEPLFTARTGEQYLIEYEFSEHWARMLYLTPVGPFEFDIKNDTDQLPFTSNCGPTSMFSFYGNFVDVSVYAESTLVTKLCDLTAGTIAPYDSSKFHGATVDISPGASPDVDKLFLNGFSARCNGADAGYVRRQSVTVSRTTYGLIPFVAIAG